MLLPQFDWLLSFGYPCTYSPQDENKMASYCVPVTDEQLPSTKRSCRSAKHKESYKVLQCVEVFLETISNE